MNSSSVCVCVGQMLAEGGRQSAKVFRLQHQEWRVDFYLQTCNYSFCFQNSNGEVVFICKLAIIPLAFKIPISPLSPAPIPAQKPFGEKLLNFKCILLSFYLSVEFREDGRWPIFFLKVDLCAIIDLSDMKTKFLSLLQKIVQVHLRPSRRQNVI